jgi:phosphoserine aminotransferase
MALTDKCEVHGSPFNFSSIAGFLVTRSISEVQSDELNGCRRFAITSLQMSRKVFNFSAGPAVVPSECLNQVATEITNWRDSGMSVLEISHRSPQWLAENDDVNSRVRRLLAVPKNFEMIFVAGGASLQFSAIPFNLLGNYKNVDYLVTGTWSKKAYEECKRLNFPGVDVNLVGPPIANNPVDLPAPSEWVLSSDAAYCYLCLNETIQGLQFQKLPDVSAPLVVDMSSEFLSRPITEWNKIGCVFACAQKNFGGAGMTIVIIRKDLLERPLKPFCPVTLDFRVQVQAKSLYNTPPTFPIYLANLIFKWVEKQGLADLAKVNQEKAAKLYKAIDMSPFFQNKVAKEARSCMNVTFFRKPDGYLVKDDQADRKFLKFAEERGLVCLGGHASVGGFRASIYNAMPEEGIDALVKAIEDFTGFD